MLVLIEQDSTASPSGAFHRSHRLAKANSQTSEIIEVYDCLVCTLIEAVRGIRQG